MSRAVRFSCALVMIALVICSSPTVATPKSTSAGVALNTLHSSHAPAVMKRRLRSTMAMETTETSEERASTFRIPEVASSFSSLKPTSAAIYEKLQRWVWRLTRQTPDNVFKLLKLDKIDKPNKISTEGAKLFENSRFKKWVNFVDAKFSKDPKAKVEAIFAILVAHYGDGAALARLLDFGKLHRGDKPIADLAAALQVAQLKHWNKNEKTVENVLEILELHKTQGNPLLDPLFSQLSAYVELKHPNDPAAATKAMSTAFREFYKDDTAWAKLLVDGTKRDSVNIIAYDLLQSQLSLWEEGEKTLFTHLGLDQIKEGLFENPLFKQWVAIVEEIHWETPKTASDVILSTLAAHFGEKAAWADILVAGTKVPRTEYLALKLMTRQIVRWRDIEKKSVDEVFTLLKLENGLFESPRMLLWLNYVERYFIEEQKAMYSRSRTAQLVGIFSRLGYDKAIKAAEKADAVAEEAKKAADEAAEEANAAAIEAKKEADAVAEEAKKAADAAARKAEEAENAVKKAEMAPYEAMLLTLRHHSKSDSALRNSLAMGMEVDYWKVRQTAKELQKMLDSSRPQEDLSKVSAPGAELDSNFDVHG
ncbi:unnamed protein product [Peronospora farinosa]|uniref:RxLR effector candidate protein n=1 Tax=Peronospora farinosa TaxID=134698 RepID=A0ABN8C4Y6_9STRA|nr:unnamed protein product [Peronospora farinosa]